MNTKTEIPHLALRHAEGCSILSLALSVNRDPFTLKTQIDAYTERIKPRSKEIPKEARSPGKRPPKVLSPLIQK